MNVSGIYQIRNTADGKVYVGLSVNIPKRWKDHKKTLRKGTHFNGYLQNAWTKYGESCFVFEVLQLAEEADLGSLEQYWIAKQCSASREYGYNLSLLVCGRVRHSDESRLKQREVALARPPISEERRQLLRDAQRARPPLSAEASLLRSQRMSASRTGKTFSPEQRANMAAAQQALSARNGGTRDPEILKKGVRTSQERKRANSKISEQELAGIKELRYSDGIAALRCCPAADAIARSVGRKRRSIIYVLQAQGWDAPSAGATI